MAPSWPSSSSSTGCTLTGRTPPPTGCPTITNWSSSPSPVLCILLKIVPVFNPAQYNGNTSSEKMHINPILGTGKLSSLSLVLPLSSSPQPQLKLFLHLLNLTSKTFSFRQHVRSQSAFLFTSSFCSNEKGNVI